MTLQQELALRAAHLDEIELLSLMGYSRPTAKHRQRLRAVLADPLLGLRVSAFDFRFGNRAYIQVLGQVLGVSHETIRLELQKICEQLEAEQRQFKPVVHVDTDFKRTTQPIFALAACEHQRSLTFTKSELQHYFSVSVAERVHLVSEKVKQHYEHCQGHLGIWGSIQRYVYHHDDSHALVLLPDGTVREEIINPDIRSCASMTLKGKPLSGLFKGAESDS